jgi:hypothetical protein
MDTHAQREQRHGDWVAWTPAEVAAEAGTDEEHVIACCLLGWLPHGRLPAGEDADGTWRDPMIRFTEEDARVAIYRLLPPDRRPAESPE